jgi:hypothetical protein
MTLVEVLDGTCIGLLNEKPGLIAGLVHQKKQKLLVEFEILPFLLSF